MRNGIAEIDHLLTAVDDPQAAGEDYERLGFTVTPLSIIESMGLANRLVLMDPLTPDTANFVELMGMQGDPARVNDAMRGLLSGPQAVRSMVMTTPDADAAQAELAANGYEPGPVHRLRREWALPSGERLEIAFDVLLPIRGAPFAFNLCRYRTLRHYLRPEWRRHANGAQSLVAVNAVSDDPGRAAAYYERLFGARAVWEQDEALSIGPGSVRLRIYSPDGFAAAFGMAAPVRDGYGGYSVRVASLAAARDLLSRRDAPFVDLGARGVAVQPEAARGNVLHFSA